MSPRLTRRHGWSALALGLDLTLILTGVSVANDDGHKKRKRHGRQATVINQTYRQTCGQCHMVYHPGLLPAASWRRLLANS